jgi:caffeoyl-CoA O-methyltransferase
MENQFITADPISHYAELYTTAEAEVLAALNRETQANVRGAQMLSGHLQGMLLQMISQMVKPQLILELGTYTGYSAICLAKGLMPGGMLHTVDIDNTLQEMRDRYWTESGLQHCITQHIGPADQIIDNISGTFDLVFIDADKKNYERYFDLVIDRMVSGGIILADNVLFHAEVIRTPEEQSNNAKAMHAFNCKIAADNRVEQVMLPIRDGISLIRKL